jgi:hypothetical protein
MSTQHPGESDDIQRAITQCVADLKEVWQQETSLLILDLAMASLRDDALVLVQQARRAGNADPLLARAEKDISAVLYVYAHGGMCATLERVLTVLWRLPQHFTPEPGESGASQ